MRHVTYYMLTENSGGLGGLAVRDIVQSDSFVDQVYEIIRRHIITMSLKPGEKLGVDQLASSLGVSRTPVREALNLLVREGLVTVRPRVGYYVVELTPVDIQEICGIRKMIELYSLEEAAKNVPLEKWQELLQYNLDLVAYEEDDIRSRFFRADQDLHGTIILATSNNRLQEVSKQIWAFVDLMFNMNKRIGEATQEHIAILNALCTKDVNLAKQRLAAHINNVCAAIIRNL